MGNSPSTPSAPPPLSQSQNASHLESACPVDPSARQAYLDAAASTTPPTAPPKPTPETSTNPPQRPTFFYGVPTSFLPSQSHPAHQQQPPSHRPLLGESRVTSSIPRSTSTTTTDTTHTPNAQTSQPLTSRSGNWVYPSEKQFYDAMTRKNHSPTARDMSTVVPLHNAVNERVWHLIKTDWEHKYAGDENAPCDGPRLLEFKGQGAGRKSPRAKWLGLWGYEEPFDRHDWVVERCPVGVREQGWGDQKGWGEVRRVEYVIDFYRGRGSASGGGGKVGFFLDVRPKLNSWEGWRMRARRVFGL